MPRMWQGHPRKVTQMRLLRRRPVMRSRHVAAVVALCAAAGICGCGGSAPAPKNAALPQRTCLVLSVGGSRGVAHLGAIAATKQSGLRIDCVVGNSMGALVGSLFASAPAQDTTERYKAFIKAYVERTKSDAGDNGVLAGLVGAGLVLISGGAALPALLAAGGGYVVGASSTNKLDNERLVQVLDRCYGGLAIEQLPMPYTTFFVERNGASTRQVERRTGNLAEAVGASVANPFIFEDINVRAAGALDPGLDRVAATPIEDACRLFPDARLLAVNVTGQPLFYSSLMHCPVIEVRVDANTPDEAILPGVEFDAAVMGGCQATMRALAALPATNSPVPADQCH